MRKVYYADFYIKIKFKKNFKEGAFALAFKSIHFPGECVATRRGSPLLVGIKTKTRLATDHIPILYKKGNGFFFIFLKKFYKHSKYFNNGEKAIDLKNKTKKKIG